jgi:uncharacterized protein (DUF2267 family)
VGEAEDIAERLPGELQPCVEPSGSPQTFHLDGFIKRLEEHLGVDRSKAEQEAKAVFAALWSTVGSQLPGEYHELLRRD